MGKIPGSRGRGLGSIPGQGTRAPHGATESLHAATEDLVCCSKDTVQCSAVAQSCPTLCGPRDCSMPGFANKGPSSQSYGFSSGHV